jgi:hypothetical protein
MRGVIGLTTSSTLAVRGHLVSYLWRFCFEAAARTKRHSLLNTGRDIDSTGRSIPCTGLVRTRRTLRSPLRSRCMEVDAYISPRLHILEQILDGHAVCSQYVAHGQRLPAHAHQPVHKQPTAHHPARLRHREGCGRKMGRVAKLRTVVRSTDLEGAEWH